MQPKRRKGLRLDLERIALDGPIRRKMASCHVYGDGDGDENGEGMGYYLDTSAGWH